MTNNSCHRANTLTDTRHSDALCSIYPKISDKIIIIARIFFRNVKKHHRAPHTGSPLCFFLADNMNIVSPLTR